MDPLTLLQDLIRLPSLNPDGVTETEFCGERRLAEFLATWLKSGGAEVTLEEVLPGRPNLIARFAPMDGRPRVLFGPHLDTVGIRDMNIAPFAAEIRDGKVWGRGASDTKGPMAAMLAGIWKHRDQLKNAPIAVDFVAFMDEESGQRGSIDFAQKHARDYAFAFVGEPTSLNLVHVTKGSLIATLIATGKAAHSSQPALGKNAIVALSKCILALEESFTPILASFQHPILGGSTLNPAIIRGGTRHNIVPARAELDLDIRVTPALAQSPQGALGQLEAFLANHCPEVQVLHSHYKAPMELPADHPFLALAQSFRPATRCVGAPWFSDAAHLSTAGLPSVCIGPGSIDQAHTRDEFIEIDAFLEGVAYFESLVAKLIS